MVFSRNWHPMLSMCLAHGAHPLSRGERWLLGVHNLAWLWLTSALWLWFDQSSPARAAGWAAFAVANGLTAEPCFVAVRLLIRWAPFVFGWSCPRLGLVWTVLSLLSLLWAVLPVVLWSAAMLPQASVLEDVIFGTLLSFLASFVVWFPVNAPLFLALFWHDRKIILKRNEKHRRRRASRRRRILGLDHRRFRRAVSSDEEMDDHPTPGLTEMVRRTADLVACGDGVGRSPITSGGGALPRRSGPKPPPPPPMPGEAIPLDTELGTRRSRTPQRAIVMD